MDQDLLPLTADVVASYLASHQVPAADVPALIETVHAALARLGMPAAEPEPTYEPAVSVKKSITPGAIISLIDGKPYKSMKRHLTAQGLTPEEYRQRYKLPLDYPMVAPNYAAERSALAKAQGLGAQRRKAASPARKRANA